MQRHEISGRGLADIAASALVEKHEPFMSPDMLTRVPPIYDESLSRLRTNLGGLTAEGAGGPARFRCVRLRRSAHRATGHALRPHTLPSGRCYAFVCSKTWRDSANVRAFRAWLGLEAAALDGARARHAQPI